MTVEKARELTESALFVASFKETIKSLPITLEIFWKKLLWAIEDGQYYLEMPYLPANVKAALDGGGFKMTRKNKNGRTTYIVSWTKKEQNADRDRNGKG